MATTLVEPTPSRSGWKVWGHDRAVHDLQLAIRDGVRHAYILSGYEHIGKKTLALEFARSLVCLNPPLQGLYCGACPACRRVVRGTHSDVTVYDLARQQQSADKTSASKNLSLNIQTVRDISSSISRRPMEARHRVVIVDDVGTMQETAQEAFLKTLEEPPPYAVIFLLATDSELLLQTVRSRCSTIQLQTVHSRTIAEMLQGAGVAGDDAATIAAASVGRPGWAIRAARDADLLRERLELASTVVSWITGPEYKRMTEAIRLGDAFLKDRLGVYAQLTMAQTIWRQMMAQVFGLSDLHDGSSTLQLPDRVTANDILVALRSVERCLSDLDANVRPRLALESMVLQWPSFTP